MAHDARAGRPLELEWLSGAVARMGRAAGVATPVNNAVAAALRLGASAP
jgi:2-dehydropantoate 2-reductase